MSNQNDSRYSRESLKKKAEAILNFDLDSSEDVVAIFDTELNYLIANNSACRLLLKKQGELEDNNLLRLFPQLTASTSHRHLLSALSGKTISDAISEGSITKDGARFLSYYYPLKDTKGVYAVIALTKKLYFPL